VNTVNEEDQAFTRWVPVCVSVLMS